MDLSSTNNIAIGLANSLFIFNHKKMDFSCLYEAYDCEEISSLSWNPSGTQLCVGNILGEI